MELIEYFFDLYKIFWIETILVFLLSIYTFYLLGCFDVDDYSKFGDFLSNKVYLPLLLDFGAFILSLFLTVK